MFRHAGCKMRSTWLSAIGMPGQEMTELNRRVVTGLGMWHLLMLDNCSNFAFGIRKEIVEKCYDSGVVE